MSQAELFGGFRSRLNMDEQTTEVLSHNSLKLNRFQTPKNAESDKY